MSAAENQRREGDPEHRPRNTLRTIVGGAVLLGAAAIGHETGMFSRAVNSVMDEDGIVTTDRGDATQFFQEVGPTPWDDNPEYFRKFESGNFSKEERAKRTTRLSGGEVIFHDVGMDFYRVERGDTISGIRKKLSRYPQYRHVDDQLKKLESFNIPARELQAGLFIPIPMQNVDRIITDEQFANYSVAALQELSSDPHYGKHVQALIKSVGAQEVVAVMLAIAKNESGGKPLGQFEFHRWEPHKNAFSFSIFHVLMGKGSPGSRARRSLDMTEGQTYHPKNAVKLFMGFLIEKVAERRAIQEAAQRKGKRLGEREEKITNYFPLPKHYEAFAVLYNGSAWRRVNPHYVKLLSKYYKQANALLDEGDDAEIAAVEPEKEKEPEVKPGTKAKTSPKPVERDGRRAEPAPSESGEKFASVGHGNLFQTILNANHINGRPLKTNKEAHRFVKRVILYLQQMNGNSTYFPEDEIAVGSDSGGKFVRFKRGNKSEILRI